MSKTKPQQHILDKSGSLLRHVTHSEFKELLLPSLQKTMLRSPENAMQSETPVISDLLRILCRTCTANKDAVFISAAVSCLLSAVTLDLSQYAMDIGKAIASKTVIES